MQVASLRKAYGEALVEIGKEDSRVVALEADLGKSTMSITFQTEFPNRYFQMGIAEQNMASTAAGFALAGKIPCISTFAVFATGRAYDQIRSSIVIPNLTVLICGSSAGLSDYGDGKTHQSIDDLAIMRVLPNMTVLSPVDAVETKQMVHAMLSHKGPVYLRINRSDLPVLTTIDKPYTIGQMVRMREGKDVVIFSTGIMVSKSLEAASLLQEEGISARVVNLSTIKPIDKAVLLEHCKGMKAVVTAEEHNVYCGLGSAVCETLSDQTLPIGIVGVNDTFGTSAQGYEELLKAYGLTAQAIANKARILLKK